MADVRRSLRSYWSYRLAFFGCILASVGLVLGTISYNRGGMGRASAAPARRPAVGRVAPAGSGLNAPSQSSLLAGSAGTTALMSRVRISAVIPFQREIQLHNFGDAAEDLSNWTLMSPGPGTDDRYTIPVGTILLPGESLLVVVEEGVDEPGVLYWRVPGDHRVLDQASDTVVLYDADGTEVSRFTYVRR